MIAPGWLPSSVGRVATPTSYAFATPPAGWVTCEALATDLRADPAVGGIVLNMRDISERKALENELRHQAFHDSLTGLANRALFADRLEHALALQARADEPVAVLLIDSDDCEGVNDSLAHRAGDQLLAQVAARLRGCGRAADTVTRLGGDEFAILLEDHSADRPPEAVADRVLDAFREPLSADGRRIGVTASVGLAIAPTGVRAADGLLRDSDVAMYQAKASGKSRWVRFEPGMQLAIKDAFELRADLATALDDGAQLALHYQPIVTLQTGAIVGVEALLRWQHPTRGLLTPAQFLPVAEESGLIVPAGRWVLREACAQLQTWRRSHPSLAWLSVSVNVSGRQFEDPHLVGDVERALIDSGLAPAALMLEITETVLMTQTGCTVEALRQLKALGGAHRHRRLRDRILLAGLPRTAPR